MNDNPFSYSYASTKDNENEYEVTYAKILSYWGLGLDGLLGDYFVLKICGLRLKWSRKFGIIEG